MTARLGLNTVYGHLTSLCDLSDDPTEARENLDEALSAPTAAERQRLADLGLVVR